jgi:hypothetical protein
MAGPRRVRVAAERVPAIKYTGEMDAVSGRLHPARLRPTAALRRARLFDDDRAAGIDNLRQELMQQGKDNEARIALSRSIRNIGVVELVRQLDRQCRIARLRSGRSGLTNDNQRSAPARLLPRPRFAPEASSGGSSLPRRSRRGIGVATPRPGRRPRTTRREGEPASTPRTSSGATTAPPRSTPAGRS